MCWPHWDWSGMLVGGPASGRLEGVGSGALFSCVGGFWRKYLHGARGGAGLMKVLVRPWGPRGFPPGNLRLRLTSSDGRVQAVLLSYREPGGAQEGSDTSPSHPATVPSPVPALPSWPGSRLTALRVGILALVHHKPAPCFPPNLRLQTPHHCAGLTWPGSEEKRLRGRSWGFAHLPPVPSDPV